MRHRPYPLVVDADGEPFKSTPAWTILGRLDRVDQSKLYLNGIYAYNELGAAVNLYMIDTGISPHFEFGSRLRPGRNLFPGNGIVDLARTTDP